jgi:hypothetical protein
MPSRAPGPAPGTQADAPVFLSVVRGEPTDAELAALVAILATRAADAAAAAGATLARAPRSRWSDRSRLMRPGLSPGPDAWRRSTLPR